MAANVEPSKSRLPRLGIILGADERTLKTWAQLARTFTRMVRRLDQALEVHGLSVPQFDILATLGVEEGITQQELAKRLLVTKGNICGMIDRMQASGWVERRADPSDRRANRLFLTGPGKHLLGKAFPGQKRLLDQMFETLGEGETQSLYQFLVRLEDGVEG